MKNLLALALAVFSFAAVNADDLDTDTNDDTTILPIEDNDDIVDSDDGCPGCRRN